MVDVRNDILPEELLQEDKNFVVELIEAFKQQNQQFLASGERARRPQPAKNIVEFFELTKQVIEDKEIANNIIEDQKVLFTPEYPPQELDKVTISFSVVRREPASTSQGRHFNQQRQEWKPRVREIIDDPNNPGYKLMILGQKFENIVQFIIWAKTHKEANKRAEWFEDLMREYAWFIKYKGVDEFYMLERGEDIILDVDQQRIVGRPFHYYVRTEKLTYLSEPTIRRIILELGIK
jgi:hypothetical protein